MPDPANHTKSVIPVANSPTETKIGESRPAENTPTASFHAVSALYSDFVPHARGGLGEVFAATDTALNRTVAVKRLQDKRSGDADSRRRFLVEAEVTARLEHPGVVPVYTLFTDDRGSPAYAMRFLEGQTLAEAIAAYHAGPSDPVAFRRLLQSFLQVCQTVAYAHSRGVIHRDLKPANVMLGKFGETLVVDWGLAKVVGRPEEVRAEGVGETLVPSSIDSEPGETAMGSAIGTPAYMSPEQAAGRWDVVAQPSDIYSLGAVLYTVLTGRPPLEKGNWPEMQQKIQQGDFPRPRQVKADISRSLEAICLKAMAVVPSARYASAESLAADVEHWMADEPVSAHREPLTARGRRWMRNHRTLVGVATVLLVATVVGLAAGTVLLDRKNREIDGQRQSAVTAQKKAEAMNRFLIDDLLKQADPANNPVGDKITVRDLLDKAAARLDAGAGPNDQPEVEVELRAVIGHAYQNLAVYDKAERHYRRAWELQANLLGPDQPETLELRNDLVWVVLEQDRPEVESMASDALAACSRALGEENPVTGRAVYNLGSAYVMRGNHAAAEPILRRSLQILNSTLGPDDTRTLEVDNDLAIVSLATARPAEAEQRFGSVADRRRRLNPHDPELPRTLANLAAAKIAQRQFGEAVGVLNEAIALGTAIGGPDTPAPLQARNLLGFALEGQGQFREAEDVYLKVLADRRRVQGPTHFGTQFTLAFLSRLFAKQSRWTDATPYLAELLLAHTPNPNRKPNDLVSDLNAIIAGTADAVTAEPLLKECWTVLKLRTLTDDWLRAEIASRYGDCLRQQGKFAEAEPVLTTAAKDMAKAVGVPAWGLPAARKRVADLYVAWKKPDEAAKWK
jgi:eukaryotic-like serine/threonine-protein kinase